MADHVREQIRAAAIATLTGITGIVSVHDSLVYALEENQLPALRIDLGDEDIVPGSTGGRARTISRTVPMTVDICLKDNAEYEKQANNYSKEVEIRLANNNTLVAGDPPKSLCKSITPRRIETRRTGEGEKITVLRRLTFQVFYVTAMNAPDVPM